jgi:hypothetical protein
LNQKTLVMTGIISLVLLLVTFVGPIHSPVFGIGLDTYGNLYFEMANRDQNESFTKTNPTVTSDLWTYTAGDLFLRGSEDDSLLQFLVDYKFEGDLQDSGHPSPTGYFNQYYFIVPFDNGSFLYCGQKYKKAGVANFFTISNRYERAGYPAKLIEYDILKSDNFNYGFIANFKDASGWEQVQYSGFIDVHYKNFNLQGYCFREGNRGYSVVADLTYQAGIYQLYGETLWMSQADQKVANLNPSDSNSDTLDYRNENGATKMVAGIMINHPNYSIALEYMQNNEAYTCQEREDFINYLDRHPGKHQFYTDYFSYNWAQSYLGLNWYLPTLGNDECSLTNSLIASVPDEGASSEYASYQFYSNIAYSIFQNLTLNFNLTYHFGGAKGEYLNLYEDAARYQLSLLFSF